MPLVPAAGYPTLQQPSVSPAAEPPNAYQSVQARPEAFGSLQAQALQRLGGAIEESGQGLYQQAIARQKLHNDVSAHDASYQMQDEWNKILYGDPATGEAGFYNKKGRDAVEAEAGARQGVINLFKNSRAGLQNDFQRLEFDNETRRLMNFTLADIGRHGSQQQLAYAHDTNKAQYELGLQGATAHANDPAAFNAHVDQMMKAAVRDVQLRGGGQDQLDAAMAKVRSDAVTAKVEAMSTDNPTSALKFLEDNKDAVSAQHYHTLSTGLKTKATDRQAVSMAYGLNGSNDYSRRVTGLEGTGKDPRSSAVAGFIESTWLNVMHGEPEAQGKSNADILALRTNPTIVARMNNKYAEENGPKLEAQGLPVNNTTLYLSHLLGPQGAIDVLKSPAEAKVPDSVIGANNQYKGMTAGRLVGLIADKMGDTRGTPSRQNMEETIARLKQDVGDNPELFHKALSAIESRFRVEDMDRLNHQRELKDRSDAASDQYVRDILGNRTDGIIDRIRNDPNLTFDRREHLANMAFSFTKKEADPDMKTYGPGFWDAYKRMFLEDGDPRKLTSADEIYRMAGPDGNLTVRGADKLKQIITDKKTPEGEANRSVEQQFFKSMHKEIAGKIPATGEPDPKGEELYQKFLIDTFPQIAKLRAEGKSNFQIFDPASADYVGKALKQQGNPYQRTPQEIIQDMLTRGMETLPGVPAAAIQNLRAHPDTRKAFDEFYGAGMSDRVLGKGGPVPPAAPPIR